MSASRVRWWGQGRGNGILVCVTSPPSASHQQPIPSHTVYASPPKDIETPIVVTDAHVVDSPTSKAEYHQHISPPSSPIHVPTNNSNTNTNSDVVVPLYAFQRGPMNIKSCHACGAFTRTRTISAPNLTTWIAVVVLFFLFWPLCWVPLVNEKCKRTDHYCSKCNVLIGFAQPLEGCCVTYRAWYVRVLWFDRMKEIVLWVWYLFCGLDWLDSEEGSEVLNEWISCGYSSNRVRVIYGDRRWWMNRANNPMRRTENFCENEPKCRFERE